MALFDDKPSFLIAEDQIFTARALARFFRQYGETQIVETAERALEALEDEKAQFHGAIIDWRLGEDDGVEVIRKARLLRPKLPILLLTGHLDAGCVNQVHALRAEYACKPARAENLAAFAERAVSKRGIDPMTRAINEIARRHKLSTRERIVLALAVRGLSRLEMAERMGIKESTVKTLTRRMLAKTNMDRVRSVVHAVIGEAMANQTWDT
ncbi:MAG: response regulator transcription factor [Myxococcales bacterium]|nr:response regulator transcription factor [Myxococcales bacterium]